MDAPCWFETRHDGEAVLPTHRHGRGYAALVIDGQHLEACVDGAFECTPGTLLLHPAYHAHGNRFGRRGARVINMPLPDGVALDGLRAWRVPHLDEARAMFQREPCSLAALLAQAMPCTPVELPDWQPALLQALADSELPIGALCRQLGVSLAHASRALARSHGMSPQLLRRELRWRRALSLLHGENELSDIALRCGFSDQSHFTRVTRRYAGLPPAALRQQIKSVQDAPAAAAVC